MKILIRQEQQADIGEIYELNKTAFGQENEGRLVDLIRNGQGFVPELSLVALAEARLIGYILFSKIHIVSGDNRHQTLALAPMAVHPDWQKQGIGSKLITQGLQVAKELGFTSAIVLGHELYYPRFGFLPASKWNIKAPIDLPSNVFMAIELIPNGLSNISGTVEYPVEFSTI